MFPAQCLDSLSSRYGRVLTVALSTFPLVHLPWIKAIHTGKLAGRSGEGACGKLQEAYCPCFNHESELTVHASITNQTITSFIFGRSSANRQLPRQSRSGGSPSDWYQRGCEILHASKAPSQYQTVIPQNSVLGHQIPH